MKKRTVVFLKKAEEDLDSITDYIASDNLRVARAFRDSIRETCALLLGMPGLGIFRSFGNPKFSDMRFWPLKGFEKYLIFYRITEQHLEVIRVLHGARDLSALFSEEPEE
jgi:toxin ParE1/3/4